MYDYFDYRWPSFPNLAITLCFRFCESRDIIIPNDWHNLLPLLVFRRVQAFAVPTLVEGFPVPGWACLVTNVRGSALQSPCNHGKVLCEVGRLYSRRAENQTKRNGEKPVLHMHNDINVTLYRFHIVHSREKEPCVLQCSADLCLTSRGYFVTTTQEGRNLKITLASYFCIISCTKCTHGIIKWINTPGVSLNLGL